MSKSTTIVTSTTALSAAADAILALQDKGKPLTKNALLNTLAAQIAGPRHNWGYLTSSKAPIVQRNLPAARLRDLADISAPAPMQAAAGSTASADPAAIEMMPSSDLLMLRYTRAGEMCVVKLSPNDILYLYEQMLPIDTQAPGKEIRIEQEADQYLIMTGPDPVEMRHLRHGELVGCTRISLTALEKSVEAVLDAAVEKIWATHTEAEILNVISDALWLETESFTSELIEGEMTSAAFERTVSIATLVAYSRMEADCLPLRDMLKYQGQDAILNTTLDGDYTSFLHQMLGNTLDEEDDEDDVDDTPARYVVADNWSHLLDGGRDTDIRWVWDREEERLVALRIWRNRTWQAARREEFDNVTDHLANANPEALEKPADYGAYAASSLPDWAEDNG